MRQMRISINTIRRVAILFILYIASGSTYITIENSLQRLPYLALILLSPAIINSARSKVSKDSFKIGLFVYGFSALAIVSGILHGDNLYSYTRIAVNQIFAFYITYEFSFKEFKDVFVKFMTAVAFVSLIFYAYLQIAGQISFFPRIANINNIYYRIGWIFNYIEYLPQRNLGIYWEPGLFATSLILAVIIEIVFTEKPSIWRLILYHICIITTYSTAGYVLLILCDLVLLDRWIVKHQSIGRFNYVIFFLIYILLGFVIVNIDALLSTAGLLEHSVYGRLTTDNISNSMRMLAISRNLELFMQRPISGFGISEAYSLATGYPDTSTTTFLLVELGIIGILPTIALIISIIKLRKDLIISITLAVSFLFIINKEPHMGIAIVWVFMFYFMRMQKMEEELKSEHAE